MALNEEVKKLAESMQASLDINKSTGVIFEKESDTSLYESNLPEGLTIQMAKDISDYNSSFIAAGAYAFGHLSVEAMAKDKKLERTTGEIKMAGKDSISFSLDRHKEYPGHLSGGDKVEKFGVISSNYEVYAGRNAGQLKQARLAIGELALEKLK